MACEAWTADSSFPSKAMYGVSAVTNATESQCRIRGLPQTYFGDETYTIAVVSDNIVARKLFASQGAITASSRSGPRPSVEEGEPSPLCYNCDRPVYGAVLFDWTAPAVGSGDVTFAALCGGSSIGLGGSGFVAATPHLVTTPATEGYPDAGHRVDTSALEEFILAGRTASAHGSHDSHASSSSSHAAMGGHGMVFAAFSPLHPSLTILFKGWDVTTSPQYAGAIICFFVLGVLVRLLRILLGSIRRRASRHSFVSQTGIFFIINTLAYALMLAAMTYDVGIFFSIVFGMTFGFWIELHVAEHVLNTSKTLRAESLAGTAGGRDKNNGAYRLDSIEQQLLAKTAEEDLKMQAVDCCTTEVSIAV